MAVNNPTVLRGGLKILNGVAGTVPVNAILDEDNFSSNSDEALATQQSIKAYVDNVASGYNRRNAVIAIATSTSAPPTEVSGDRYILDNSGAPHANWDGASQGDIVEFNGTTWDATTPSEGWVAYSDTDNKDALCVDDGTLQWELRNVAITNHNDLSNIDGGTSGEYYHMTSAQHTSIVGGSSDASSLHHHDGRYYTETEVDNLLPADGTAAGQMLHWSGSAWANTEVSELYFDDTNKRLGLGTASPDYMLEIVSASAPYFGISYYAANTTSSSVILRKARGTEGTPADVVADDGVGTLAGNAWIGGAYDRIGDVRFLVNDVHTTYASGYISFRTSDTSGNFEERLRVEEDGAILFPDMTAPGTTTNRLYNTTTGLFFDGTRLDVDTSGFVDTSGTPANDQIAVFTDANTIEGTANFTYNGSWHVVSKDTANTGYEAHVYDSTTNYPRYYLVRGRGTKASPTAIQSGDVIGSLLWNGYRDTSVYSTGAKIEGVAAGNFSVSSYGTDLIFYTTAVGSTTVTERLRIEDDGAILFPDITAPGTTTNRLYNTSTGLFFDGTRLDVDTSGFVDASGTPADNQIAVFTDANTIEGSSTFTWSAGNLSMGNTLAFSQGMELWSEGSAGDNNHLQIIAHKSAGDNINSSAWFVSFKANGTIASPTDLASGDSIGGFQALGRNSSTWKELGRIHWYVDDTPTGGAYIPGRCEIYTYDNAAEGGKWTFDHEGAITFKEVSAPSTTTNKLYNTSTGLFFDGTRLDVDTSGFVDTSGTPANNQIAVFTDADTIEGDAAFVWDGDSLGIGTTTPALGFEMVSEGSTAGTNRSYLQIKGHTSSGDNANSSPWFCAMKANGTIASPTDIVADDHVGGFQAIGYDESTWKELGRIHWYCDETPGVSSPYIPGRCAIYTYDNSAIGGQWTFDHEGAITFKEVTAPGTTTNKLYNTATGLYFDGVRLDIDSTTDSRLTSGTAAGQLLFWDGSDSYDPTETTEMVWDDTNKWLGIGIGSPTDRFIIAGADHNDTSITIRRGSDDNAGGSIKFHTSRGSVTSPTATLGGDTIGDVSFNGYYSGVFYAQAYMRSAAIDTYTATARGTQLSFFTTSTSSTTAEERIIIKATGEMWMQQISAPSTTTDRLYNVSGNLYWDGFRLNENDITDGTAAGQVTFWNGSTWTYTETTEVVWDDTNKWLGIGIASPTDRFIIAGADHNDTSLTIRRGSADANGGSIKFHTSRGSVTSPTTILGGDTIGDVSFNGYYNGVFYAQAWIRSAAMSTYTASDRGTQLSFFTTDIGSTTANERIIIKASGEMWMQQISAPGTTTDRLYNVGGDLYWDGFQLNVDSTADSRLTSGTAAGQMLFWDGTDSWDPTETSELFWDDTNKRLGIGGNAPYSALELDGDSQLQCSITITEGHDTDIPFVFFRRSRGTGASRTAVQAGDALGGLHMRGWINSDWNACGSLRWRVNATHTTYVSTYFAVYTNDTSNTNTERFRIEPDGAVKLTTSGKLYTDSNDLTLATETSGNILVDSIGQIRFDDQYRSGWTLGYMPFSLASSEWTDFEANFGGEVSLLNGINQAYEAGTKSVENTDVDTGTEDVDTFADTVAKGATWSYIVTNGTNHRAGIVIASWNATADTVTYTDVSTSDQGDTSQLTFSVDINTNTVRFRATATTDNWNVQAERKLIARA